MKPRLQSYPSAEDEQVALECAEPEEALEVRDAPAVIEAAVRGGLGPVRSAVSPLGQEGEDAVERRRERLPLGALFAVERPVDRRGPCRHGVTWICGRYSPNVGLPVVVSSVSLLCAPSISTRTG